MRKPIIAGNWKMFKTRDEAIHFILRVNDKMPDIAVADTVICAQATVLRCLVKRQAENLRIGAQNMHWADEGAYTGEVSARMLKSIGVKYVIIGHSERRAMFGETDESVNKKMKKAFETELIPILCVGESLSERENRQTEELLRKQLTKDLEGIPAEDITKAVIAYEPIWAIGTGKTATAETAGETCSFIRRTVGELYDGETAEAVRILYGGSVKTSNIDGLMKQRDIDGALIGGASLNPDDFIVLAEAALKKRF